MNCHIFTSDKCQITTALISTISGLIGQDHVSVFDSLEDLYDEIVSRKTDTTITILLLDNRSQLVKILQNCELFSDTILLLSIWNQDPKIIHQCYSLKPRLICTSEDELLYIFPMVKKIKEHQSMESSIVHIN